MIGGVELRSKFKRGNFTPPVDGRLPGIHVRRSCAKGKPIGLFVPRG